MSKIECFKIRIYKANNPFNFTNGDVIKDILCSKTVDTSDVKAIEADPFLFMDNDTLYLFYEDKTIRNNAWISMTCTQDLIHWSDPATVLKESCHLSYPWVFEENGRIYMIPESCGLKSIRLYEANENLTKFSYVKTILTDDREYTDGFSFSDTSIYKKDGYYYLMTTINDGKTNILKLYISDKFDSAYKEHPMSPICSNNNYGRNAGSLFEYGSRLYRVAQNCEKRYGDNVNLLEIEEMSPTVYKERSVKDDIIPTSISFYREGGHQFNMVNFRGQYVIATDAKEYNRYLPNRVLHKFGLIK